MDACELVICQTTVISKSPIPDQASAVLLFRHNLMMFQRQCRKRVDVVPRNAAETLGYVEKVKRQMVDLEITVVAQKSGIRSSSHASIGDGVKGYTFKLKV